MRVSSMSLIRISITELLRYYCISISFNVCEEILWCGYYSSFLTIAQRMLISLLSPGGPDS